MARYYKIKCYECEGIYLNKSKECPNCCEAYDIDIHIATAEDFADE